MNNNKNDNNLIQKENLDISLLVSIKNQSFSLYLALSSLNYGQLLSNLNIINDRLRYFYNQSDMNPSLIDSLLSISVPMGGFIATMICSYIPLTPIKIIMLGNVIQTVGILATFQTSEYQLIIFGIARFIIGFGVGLSASMVTFIIGNICNHKIRGALSPLHQIMCTVGISISFAISQYYSLPGNDVQRNLDDFGDQWKLIQGLPLLFIGLQVLLQLTLYSKHDVLHKPDQDHVQQLVNQFYDAHDVSNVLDDLDISSNKDHIKLNKSDCIIDKDVKISLFSRRYKFRFVFCLYLAVAQQLTGINSLIFYSSTIYKQIGSGMFIFQMTLGMGIAGVVGSSLASLFLDIFGRKNQLLYTLIAYTIVQGTMIMTKECKDYITIDDPVSSYIDILLYTMGILTFVQRLTFELGYGPILTVQMGECLPVEANSYVWAMNWFGAILVGFITKPLMDTVGLSWTQGIFMACNCVTLMVVYLYMKETKGMVRNQISRMFNGLHDND